MLGAYGEWTYDEDDAKKDNYCAYVPMMTAFVILILKWVRMPKGRLQKKKSKLRDFVPISINPSPPTIKRDILIREIF